MRPAVEIARRVAVSRSRRARVFEAAAGRCHICRERIQAGEAWELEHVIPLALGGADSDANTAPAHAACHARKTRRDRKDIAKANRLRKREAGEVRAKRPIPGRGFDGWRKFDGSPVRAERAGR